MEYDLLKRQVASIRNNVKQTNLLHAAGRTLVRKRIGSDLTEVTQERSAYDAAGRLTSQTNALGGVTTCAESVVNNKLQNTVTHQTDSGQRFEVYYRDGRLERVANNAAFPVRYLYDVEQDGTGGPHREVSWEIKYDASGGTNEWAKTYTDGAGRAYKTVHAAAASPFLYRLSTYNVRIGSDPQC